MEKIKITISPNVYDTLLADCELFEFFKKDTTLNKNSFLNELILNYYEEYTNSEIELNNNVKTLLSEYTNSTEELSIELINLIRKTTQGDKNDKSTTISFKPTKSSIDTIEYIENKLIKNSTISSFYRSLFTSYASLPRNKREQIIFKDSVNVINEAIKKKKKIYFSTSKSNVFKSASVYSLSSSKDELFNYVLVVEKNTRFTYRLSRIRGVKLLSDNIIDLSTHENYFNKQLLYAPQYLINNNETELIKIKLTSTGERLYKNIYLFRPRYISKDDNIYTFDCSYAHIIFYFSRFGEDAIILSPLQLKKRMLGYYKYSFLAYKNSDDKI